ncbi:hypothetical protein QOZ80_1AG0033320 [Eleusine coracana subsp. coracana]|nr:hypothetical protein QOZ80_1AG0033320 [Eleusine coracana subsp. coracana]
MNCPGPKGTQDYCNSSVVADMFGGYTTSGDLFDLVWRGGGRSLELEERAGSCLRFSPQFEPPVEEHVPEVPPGLPSENEMATWLYAIVKGEDHAYGDGNGGRCTDNDGWHAPLEKSSETSTDTAEATSLEKKIEKVPTAEVTDTATKETGSQSSKTRKQTAGMRSHHGVKHKLTEKRRRCKINEKLKTLQHLVPGCDKSNYTSTLEHTIQYMKSLQQKVQALGGSTSPPAAAVRPVVQPRNDDACSHKAPVRANTFSKVRTGS